MFGFFWLFLESVVLLLIRDGFSSLKRLFRVGNDLSMLYILIRSFSGIIGGRDFIVLVDNDSDFNILEVSFWKIFVLIV